MNYKIEGLDKLGQFITLELQASSPSDASRLGKEHGLQILKVSPGHRYGLSILKRKNFNKFPLLMFNQELLSLLEAGLSVVEAIETLLEKESNQETQQIIKGILKGLREGLTLSASIESQAGIFPTLYIASIRASEQSGTLSQSLNRYISYQLQVDQIRKKIITASIYPAILMIVGGLVVIFLLFYVIPKFSQIYTDTGRELPFISWLLMQWSQLIENHGQMILLSIIGIAASISYLFSRNDFKDNLRELLWKIPVIGERAKAYQLTRLYRTLGMLVSAGIPLPSAIDQVMGILHNKLQARMVKVKSLIHEGYPLSDAMELGELSTPVALRLLKVAERTGQMGEMLNRIADFHEEELNRWVDWASRLFEPLLMTFIGLVIGVIVVMMYMPIFELAGSIQ